MSVRIASVVDAPPTGGDDEPHVPSRFGMELLGRVVGRHRLDLDPFDRQRVARLDCPHITLELLGHRRYGDDGRVRLEQLFHIFGRKMVVVLVRNQNQVGWLHAAYFPRINVDHALWRFDRKLSCPSQVMPSNRSIIAHHLLCARPLRFSTCHYTLDSLLGAKGESRLH